MYDILSNQERLILEALTYHNISVITFNIRSTDLSQYFRYNVLQLTYHNISVITFYNRDSW